MIRRGSVRALRLSSRKGSDADGLVFTSLEKKIITQAPPSGEASWRGNDNGKND